MELLSPIISAIASQAGIAVLVLLLANFLLYSILKGALEARDKERERYTESMEKVAEALVAIRVALASQGRNP